MGCSFEVEKSDMTIVRMMSKPCFAAVNSAVNHRDKEDGVRIRNIRYLPFLERQWDYDANAQIDQIIMRGNITWDDCYKWWDYLMTLRFVTDVLSVTPTTHQAMRDGFKVSASFPADRVMSVLFLLRAPQFQVGIVRDWVDLVEDEEIHPDTAFVMAFTLNRFNDHENEGSYKMSMHSSSESTIVYPEHFTLKSAKLMLNRLLCDDYDEKLYSGVQPLMSKVSKYSRHALSSDKALGRFFCKKPARAGKKGNLQVIVYNNEVDDNRKVSTHHNIYQSLYSHRCHGIEVNVQELAKLLEA